MEIFTTSKIAELDQYTIANEPISAIDLMERASKQLTKRIDAYYKVDQRIAVFAGPGNNGGDALAISRLLAEFYFKVDVFIPDFGKNPSECFSINLDRLKHQPARTTITRFIDGEFPELTQYDLIIDGLFGSGLTRPLTGFPARLVRYLNQSELPIIAIDIPSGLMGEDNTGNDQEAIIMARYTFTFQFPKLSFFFKKNERFTGKWEVFPIGLHPAGIAQKVTPWHYSDLEKAVSILKPRRTFSHKGTYGHALLVAGSYGKMGAAVLAAKGCLRSGVGLLTVHLPQSGNQIMQTVVPEAMVSIDESENIISQIPLQARYKAVGIGPGLGQDELTVKALRIFLENYKEPIIIDADALNILSANPEMDKMLPENSILTPHPVEFDRLAGASESGFDRLMLAQKFAQDHRIILILKGAYTAVVFPDGNCWFNSTGNPGMATGGSGDVLTGILTGLLAQSYSPCETALLGVYLHGLSGDLALSGSSEEALLAGDIADHLGKAFAFLKCNPDFGKAEKKNQF